MDVIEFDPSSASAAEFTAWNDVLAATTAHDLPGDPIPTVADTAAVLRNPLPDERLARWLARDGAATTGTCELSLPPAPNHRLGYVEISVAPAFRRRGIGRKLLADAVRRVQREGRDAIGCEAVEDSAGARFAETFGLIPGLRSPRSILAMSEVDLRLLEDVAARVPPGYRVERLTQVPEDLIESYGRAKTAMADAPTGDISWRPLTWHPARWRELEAVLQRRGKELRVVAAVHQATGEVAALTEVTILRSAQRQADQEDTLVVPAHRGRGLGLLVKSDMLRWLRADGPAVQDIQTWNADSNAHMLAINQRLGFRRDLMWLEYEAPASAVAVRLAQFR